jgi:hypothetical protein
LFAFIAAMGLGYELGRVVGFGVGGQATIGLALAVAAVTLVTRIRNRRLENAYLDVLIDGYLAGEAERLAIEPPALSDQDRTVERNTLRRITALVNTKSRTPQEAEQYRRKAEQLLAKYTA